MSRYNCGADLTPAGSKLVMKLVLTFAVFSYSIVTPRQIHMHDGDAALNIVKAFANRKNGIFFSV